MGLISRVSSRTYRKTFAKTERCSVFFLRPCPVQTNTRWLPPTVSCLIRLVIPADPRTREFARIKQAEIDAVKNAKQAQKDKAKAEKEAKANAAKAAKAAITGEKSEEKKDDRRNNRPRREPRGNQQPRRGKRFENNDENKDGENNENKGQLNERDNNRPP